MTHKVRTTMQPDVELEVDDAEYTDLKRQGVLVEDNDDDATQAEQTEQTEQSLGHRPAGEDS
ncbi:MAG: hypothetical protein M3460_04545 [Actinomycetota bacterium]|nr:hypothetical protein [Actinomycetota bacterium]